MISSINIWEKNCISMTTALLGMYGNITKVSKGKSFYGYTIFFHTVVSATEHPFFTVYACRQHRLYRFLYCGKITTKDFITLLIYTPLPLHYKSLSSSQRSSMPCSVSSSDMVYVYPSALIGM